MKEEKRENRNHCRGQRHRQRGRGQERGSTRRMTQAWHGVEWHQHEHAIGIQSKGLEEGEASASQGGSMKRGKTRRAQHAQNALRRPARSPNASSARWAMIAGGSMLETL